MSLNKKLIDFFQQEVYDLDEDEIDIFFDEFEEEDVIQCLFNELKSIAKLNYGEERAWRLGRIFGDISKKYSVDIKAYTWFMTSNNLEQKSLLNFLSGYWDQAEANISILVKLSRITSEKISNKAWSQNLILAAIDTVAIGYVNNQQIVDNNPNSTNNIKENLQLFKEYISNISANSQSLYSNFQSLQRLLKTCLEDI